MVWLIPLPFVFFLMGMPITFSLGVTSLLGLVLTNVPLLVVVQRLWTAVDTFSLVAVPLFILAGDLMSNGGISRRLVDFAQALVGHLTSGLAMVWRRVGNRSWRQKNRTAYCRKRQFAQFRSGHLASPLLVHLHAPGGRSTPPFATTRSSW